MLPGFNQYCRELMCLAQGHNTMTPVGIEPRTSRFRVRRSFKNGHDIYSILSRVMTEIPVHSPQPILNNMLSGSVLFVCLILTGESTAQNCSSTLEEKDD